MHPMTQISEITHGSLAPVAGTELHFRPRLFVENASQVEADRSSPGPVLSRQITHERRRVGGSEGTVDRLRDTARGNIIEPIHTYINLICILQSIVFNVSTPGNGLA